MKKEKKTEKEPWMDTGKYEIRWGEEENSIKPYQGILPGTDDFYLGSLLRSDWVEKKRSKDKDETGKYQFYDVHKKGLQPYILTKDRLIHPEQMQDGLVVDSSFETIAEWSSEKVFDFYTNGKKVDLEALLALGCEVEYSYISYEDSFAYKLRPIYEIGTYHYSVFPAYPYLNIWGVKDTGKTNSNDLAVYMSFKGQNYTTPRASHVLRRADRMGTIGLDEVDFSPRKLAKNEDLADIHSCLLKGYKANSTVPRLVPHPTEGYKERLFSVYCPKVLSGVNGLEDMLLSRSIRITQIKAGKSLPDPTIQDPRISQFKNGCYRFALKFASEIRKDYLEMKKTDVGELKDRNLQLWLPLLAISKKFGLFDETLDFAEKYVKELHSESQDLPKEERFLKMLKPRFFTDDWKVLHEEEEIPLLDLATEYNGGPIDEKERRTYPKWVSRHLIEPMKIGQTSRTGKGYVVKIKASRVRTMCSRYGLMNEPIEPKKGGLSE